MRPKKTRGECIVCGHETTDKSLGGGSHGVRPYWHLCRWGGVRRAAQQAQKASPA